MDPEMDLAELARQMRVNSMASSICTMLAPHIRPEQKTVSPEVVDFLEGLVAEIFLLVDTNVQLEIPE